MSEPLVSIIIPTYNRAHLIGETLDSVLAQTYTNWECIVVDDGSTDGTEALLQKYVERDCRFQYHHRPKDRLKGANACRNFGFEQSKGAFIIWFDSDDLMHPNLLLNQYNALKDGNYNFSVCRSQWLTLDGTLKQGFRSSVIQSKDPINDYIKFKAFWHINAVCYRSEFLRQKNLHFDESLQQSQEYDFHVKVLSEDSNYAVVNEPLVKVIAVEDSISYAQSHTWAKLKSTIRVKKRFLKNAKTYGLDRSTNQFLMIALHGLFQEKTMQKNVLQSLYTATQYLYAHFLDQHLRKVYLLKHTLPVVTLLIVYNIFGTGYKLFKKSNTFSAL